MGSKIGASEPKRAAERSNKPAPAASQQNLIEKLPTELQEDILQQIPQKSVVSLASTNHQIRREIQNSTTLYERFKRFYNNTSSTPEIPKNIDDAWKLFVSHEKSIDFFRVNIRNNQGIVHQFTPDTVQQLDVSVDGRFRIACATKDQIFIWDPQNIRSPLRALASTADGFGQIHFSKNGNRLAVSDTKGFVYIWDLSRPSSQPRLWKAHDVAVNITAFSENAKYLLTASHDRLLKVWDISGAPLVARILPLDKPISQAFFRHQDKDIVMLTENGVVQTWDIKSSKSKAHTVYRVRTKYISHAVLSENVRYLATADSNNNITLYDLQAPKGSEISFEAHTDTITDIHFSDDSQSMLSASQDGVIKIWNIDDFPEKYESLMGHEMGVSHAILAGGGRYAFTASGDETLRVWNIHNLRTNSTQLFSGFVDDTLSRAEITDDNRFVVSRSIVHGQIAIIDRLTSQSVNLNLNDLNAFRIYTFALSKANNILATTFENCIHIWNLQNPSKPQKTFEQENGPIQRTYFSPNNRYLVTTSTDHAVRIWDLEASSKPCQTFHNVDYTTNASFSPDDKYLSFWSASPPRINVINLSTSSLFSIEMAQEENRYTETLFSPDSQLLVAIRKNEYAVFWDLRNKIPQKVQHFSKENPPRCIQFSPDGRFYAAALLKDKLLQIFDRDHNLVSSIVNYDDSQDIIDLKFSSDNRFVTAMLTFGSIFVWDRSGNLEECVDVCYFNEAAESIQFVQDQPILLSSADDGTISIRDLQHYPNIYCHTVACKDSNIAQLIYMSKENTILVFNNEGAVESIHLRPKGKENSIIE